MLYHQHYCQAGFQAVIIIMSTPNADGAIMSTGNSVINGIQDVSQDLLVLIMQLVPIQQRMGNCARVCRNFQAAAVAATISSSSITVHPSSQERCDSFVRWLKQHGSSVMQIKIECHGRYSLSQLPCPQLCHLDLSGMELGPIFTKQDSLSSRTNLTRLVLSKCAAPGMSGNLASLLTLTKLTKLQHLDLSIEVQPSAGGLAFPGELLLHLVQLTYLQLSASQLKSSGALQHLSALSALQHLSMDLSYVLDPGDVSGLQGLQQLTALRLQCVWYWPISSEILPALTQLTALRLLHLQRIQSVDPAVLAEYSQLQELELHFSNGVTWTAEQTAALLAAVGQQHELTKLQIKCYRPWHTPSAAAYSALTASSRLQHLELANCNLPAAAWQQMFPSTRRLPELQYISLNKGSVSLSVGPKEFLQLCRSDMQAMVSCCPGLVSLALCRGLGASSVALLRQLTGLKQLTLCTAGRVHFQDTALNLAQLTGLQDLRLFLQNSEEPGRVTPSALLQLTGLQQLQLLHISGAAFDPWLEALAGGPLRELWLSNRVSMACSALNAV